MAHDAKKNEAGEGEPSEQAQEITFKRATDCLVCLSVSLDVKEPRICFSEITDYYGEGRRGTSRYARHV